MPDDTTESQTPAAPAKTAPETAAAPPTHISRLQQLEEQGRKLLADLKLEIENTEKGICQDFQAAELKFQQFVHKLTVHIEKNK